jgi:hypothetical protein
MRYRDTTFFERHTTFSSIAFLLSNDAVNVVWQYCYTTSYGPFERGMYTAFWGLKA